MENRIIVWFSCGAASAVAAKLAVDRFEKCHVVYCDLSMDEHPDNIRFRKDIENLTGQPIEIIKSSLYDSIDEVFEATGYMSGIHGARCTQEMKRIPRIKYQLPNDMHIFGFTCEEGKRIKNFEANNPSIKTCWILQEHKLTKQDCFNFLKQEGIRLPEMYLLGYRNNNCIGCVKATSPSYWNKVRSDFPNVFQQRAIRSRELGVRLTRVKGKRIFLDELKLEEPQEIVEENISCGPQCGISE